MREVHTKQEKRWGCSFAIVRILTLRIQGDDRGRIYLDYRYTKRISYFGSMAGSVRAQIPEISA